MAVLLIEIDQVDEDQPVGRLAHRLQRLGHAVGVVLRLDVIADAAPQEDVEDLAHAVDCDAALLPSWSSSMPLGGGTA